MLGLIVLVVLFFGAIFLYAKVINDSPAEFTAGDLDAALSAQAGDGAATTGAPDTVATGQPPVPTAAPGTAPASTAVATGAATSQWVATDSSQVGYRVQEVLFGVEHHRGRSDESGRWHADGRRHAGHGRRLHR